jgi:hypothetical protein
MPYSKKELESNEHYTSLSARDEVKYNQNFDDTDEAFRNRGGKFWDTLRNSANVIQLYEKISDGTSHANPNQKLHVELYRRRYRTKIKTKDIFDRDFKEF